MEFKIGYTNDKTKIPSALESGVIDVGDLIVVETGELVFIKDGNQPLTITTPIDTTQFKYIDGELTLRRIPADLIDLDELDVYTKEEVDNKVAAVSGSGTWQNF